MTIAPGRKTVVGRDTGGDQDSFKRWAFIIGVGIFATSLSEPQVLDLPFRNLLKDDLGISEQGMATFFALGAFPWYFKIVAGLLSDSIPLFGTRRRHYLILRATFASALWAALAYLPRSYTSVLFLTLAINTMLVIGSTVVGGLLVEAGQRLGAAGGLASIRIFVENACVLLGGPLAGILAGLPFGFAAAVGAAVALAAAPVTLFLLKEPVKATYDASVLSSAYRGLQILFRSGLMWIVAVLLFFATIPQEFQTPLFYHQRNELNFSVTMIGGLRFVSGCAGLLAAVAYGFLSKRVGLRFLLALGLVCGMSGVFIYVFYWSLQAAVVIEALHGFLVTLTTLALMEVAIWVTPKATAAMGFALLMSMWNVGDALGDIFGATLVQRWGISFVGLALIYSFGTAIILCALPFLPRTLFE